MKKKERNSYKKLFPNLTIGEKGKMSFLCDCLAIIGLKKLFSKCPHINQA